MPFFRISHRTQYHYNQPVRLGPHRLVLRPRESHELRLVSLDIVTAPACQISCAGDVFGNAIATATFDATADNLLIESIAKVELTSTA